MISPPPFFVFLRQGHARGVMPPAVLLFLTAAVPRAAHGCSSKTDSRCPLYPLLSLQTTLSRH